MSGFLFALVAAFLASLAARDQFLVARMVAAQGARPLLLVVALGTSTLTCAIAAWAGTRMLADLGGAQRGLAAALALIVAGAEMLLLGPGKAPREPTNSLFAAFIVLIAQQLTDGARLVVLALAVGTAAPLPAGLGGTLGSGAALVGGWLAPHLPERLRLPRRIAGGVLALVGLYLGLSTINR